MKTLFGVGLLVLGLQLMAAESETRLEGNVLKPGETYKLETISPLVDSPDRVKILSFGPKAWVLVEYEQAVLKPGETVPANRKGQMWVNFDHVIAARHISPDALSPIGEEMKKDR
jgi:hypothetical protein